MLPLLAWETTFISQLSDEFCSPMQGDQYCIYKACCLFFKVWTGLNRKGSGLHQICSYDRKRNLTELMPSEYTIAFFMILRKAVYFWQGRDQQGDTYCVGRNGRAAVHLEGQSWFLFLLSAAWSHFIHLYQSLYTCIHVYICFIDVYSYFFFFFSYELVVWKWKYWKWAHLQKIQNRTFLGITCLLSSFFAAEH